MSRLNEAITANENEIEKLRNTVLDREKIISDYQVECQVHMNTMEEHEKELVALR